MHFILTYRIQSHDVGVGGWPSPSLLSLVRALSCLIFFFICLAVCPPFDQLLGVWYEKGNILVFVDTQQKCDTLFQDLSRAGYNGLSLHGGKDQTDRDFTIADFKNKAATLMVATSVAGRCVMCAVRGVLTGFPGSFGFVSPEKHGQFGLCICIKSE